MQQFKALCIEIKTGRFLHREDELIRTNFKLFCAKHDLDEDPTPFLVNTYEKKLLMTISDRRKFVQYLGRGLEDRKLFNIYHRFRKLMVNENKGRCVFYSLYIKLEILVFSYIVGLRAKKTLFF